MSLVNVYIFWIATLFYSMQINCRQHLAATAEMAEAETMESCPHVYITEFNEIIKENEHL